MATVPESSAKELPPGQFLGRRWIVYAALGVPSVGVDTWRLRISGLVGKPVEYTYDQLMQMCTAKYVSDFHCVTGWSINNVTWEGVPFRVLAEASQVSKEAAYVMFYCLEGYTAVIPAEDALHDDSIMAMRMNGKPLSMEQGFPARPFFPHLYGWKSAKWLTGVEFLKNYVDGYWETYGYHERGNVWGEERFKGQKGTHMPRRGVGVVPL